MSILTETPDDPRLAKELAILTCVDYRASEDPAVAWWGWWDMVVHDDSLAPSGQHVLSAHVMYVPYKFKGGWNDAAREQICERAIDTLAEYAPRIREQVVHKELLTPFDLEQQYGVAGGHWHHGDLAMDQMLMMRPTYEAAQYATPIPGLWLCSAGCHPGGDITGAAGHNAARLAVDQDDILDFGAGDHLHLAKADLPFECLIGT